jgi:hypothetical protein
MASLSRHEIETYQRDGVVVPAFRLSPERTADLRAALDEIIAANPDRRPEQLVSIHIDGVNDEGVRGSVAFLDLARDENIVDLVSALIGEDVVLWGCQAFCKPPGDGMAVPWHQDGHYWPIRPIATCTAWIALDDSTAENGCLRVIPGSHQARRHFEHYKDESEGLVLNQALVDGQIDESSAVDVELEAGQMSLHDVFLVHGSNPNDSVNRRAGIAIRYMPGSSHFRRDLIPIGKRSGYQVNFATRPLWLLRGHDRTGRNDFSVGHAN